METSNSDLIIILVDECKNIIELTKPQVRISSLMGIKKVIFAGHKSIW